MCRLCDDEEETKIQLLTNGGTIFCKMKDCFKSCCFKHKEFNEVKHLAVLGETGCGL